LRQARGEAAIEERDDAAKKVSHVQMNIFRRLAIVEHFLAGVVR
jgi:hypothetical protein